MVSQLLDHLPASERHCVIFMERDLEEVLDSQERMLARLGRAASPRERIRLDFTAHLDRLRPWLAEQPHIAVLRVHYRALVQCPAAMAEVLNEFLGGQSDVSRMASSVDPSLYRDRKLAPARGPAEVIGRPPDSA